MKNKKVFKLLKPFHNLSQKAISELRSDLLRNHQKQYSLTIIRIQILCTYTDIDMQTWIHRLNIIKDTQAHCACIYTQFLSMSPKHIHTIQSQDQRPFIHHLATQLINQSIKLFRVCAPASQDDNAWVRELLMECVCLCVCFVFGLLCVYIFACVCVLVL